MIEHVTATVPPEPTTGGTDMFDRMAARAKARRLAKLAAEASTEWPQFAPPVSLGEGPVGLVQAADREIARQTAAQLRALAAFAQSRPSTTDRAQGEKGAMSAERWSARPELLKPVSEWAAQELSIALSITPTKAEQRLHEALTIVTK